MKSGLKYGIYALAFLAALGVSAYLTTWFIVRGQPEVIVPDLTGQDPVTALKTLSDLGLNLKVQASDYSDQAPKDHILSQEPRPGARVKKKHPVKVVLSKGSARVPLPDLRGLSLKQARSILEQSRLTAGLVSQTYGSKPEQEPDRVLAQAPAPMTLKAVGAKVDLLLSLGPRSEYIVMPRLIGQPYSLALLDLEKAGLEMGGLLTETRPNWPVEAVVDQKPGPGSRAARGAVVSLTVNRAGTTDSAGYRFEVVEYQIPFGLFRREIKIRVAVGSYLFDIYESWHGPGEKVRVPALTRGPLKVQVFEDGEEKDLPPGKDNLIRMFDDKDSPFHSFR